MIQLKNINLVKIKDGGYSISLASMPALEAGQAILLRVGTGMLSIDISGGYNANLLPPLLEAIARNGVWGQKINCTAMLVKFEQLGTPSDPFSWKGQKALIFYANWKYPVLRAVTVLEESSQQLAAPVQPYMAPNPVPLNYGGSAAIAIGNAQPSFPYIKVNNRGAGRMLTDMIGQRYYLHLGDVLETDTTKRGFDCTTYVLSAYHPAGRYTGGAGDEVARLICGNAVGNDNKTGDEMKAFFAANPSGEHIMWHKETDGSGTVTSGHVVVVIQGVVHQYSSASMTYLATPVADYSFGGSQWNTRPVPGTGTTAQPALPAPQMGIPANPSRQGPPPVAPQIPGAPRPGGSPMPNYPGGAGGGAYNSQTGMRGIVGTYRR